MPNHNSPAFEPLMTTAEVADTFKVDPKTISRWVKAGKLPVPARTPGGHQRFRVADIRALLQPDPKP